MPVWRSSGLIDCMGKMDITQRSEKVHIMAVLFLIASRGQLLWLWEAARLFLIGWTDFSSDPHRSQIFGFVASVAGFSSCGVDVVKDGPVRVQKDDQAGCATVSVSQSDLHHAEAPRIGLPKTADGLIVTKTMFAAVCVMSLRPRVPDMVISILCWEPTECLEELLAHRDCCTHIGFVISNLDV